MKVHIEIVEFPLGHIAQTRVAFLKMRLAGR
jgi:hypothetical protein